MPLDAGGAGVPLVHANEVAMCAYDEVGRDGHTNGSMAMPTDNVVVLVAAMSMSCTSNV
jgi:hypothetical protein